MARASLLALRTGVKTIDFLEYTSFTTASLFRLIDSEIFEEAKYDA